MIMAREVNVHVAGSHLERCAPEDRIMLPVYPLNLHTLA